MNDLLKQLQALAPLAAAATPGPWRTEMDYEDFTPMILSDHGHVANIEDINFGGSRQEEQEAYPDQQEDNAAFIAAARNLLTQENLQALCAALVHVATPEFQVGDMVEIVASRERALPYGLGTLAQVKRYHYGLNEVVVKPHNSDYLTSYNAANVVVVKAKTTTMTQVADWVNLDKQAPPRDTEVLVLTIGGDMEVNYIDADGPMDFARGYNDYDHYTHWMPLPTPPALTEAAQPHV